MAEEGKGDDAVAVGLANLRLPIRNDLDGADDNENRNELSAGTRAVVRALGGTVSRYGDTVQPMEHWDDEAKQLLHLAYNALGLHGFGHATLEFPQKDAKHAWFTALTRVSAWTLEEFNEPEPWLMMVMLPAMCMGCGGSFTNRIRRRNTELAASGRFKTLLKFYVRDSLGVTDQVVETWRVREQEGTLGSCTSVRVTPDMRLIAQQEITAQQTKEYRLKRGKQLWEQGHLSDSLQEIEGAESRRMALSPELLMQTQEDLRGGGEEVREELRDFDLDPAAMVLKLEESTYNKGMHQVKGSGAAGLSGAHPGLYQVKEGEQDAEAKRYRRLCYEIARLVAAHGAPEAIQELITARRLVLIPKEDRTKFRKIQIGEAYFKFIWKAVTKQMLLNNPASESMPLQFSHGNGGSPACVSAHNAMREADDEACTVHVDIKEAFDNVSWNTVLRLCRRRFPHLLPFINSVLHHNGHVLSIVPGRQNLGEVNDVNGDEREQFETEDEAEQWYWEQTIRARKGYEMSLEGHEGRGLPQGEAYSAWLFSIIVGEILKCVQEDFPEVLITGYADDVQVTGPPEVVQRAVIALQEFMRSDGLLYSLEKCVVLPSTSNFLRLQQQLRQAAQDEEDEDPPDLEGIKQAWRDSHAIMLQGADAEDDDEPSVPCKVEDSGGMTVLGIPIGERDAMDRLLMAIVEESRHTITVLKSITHSHSIQHCMNITRYCILAKPVHVLAACPSQVVRNSAIAFDSMIKKEFKRWLQVQEDLTPHSRYLLEQSTYYGGVGLTPMSERAAFQHLEQQIRLCNEINEGKWPQLQGEDLRRGTTGREGSLYKSVSSAVGQATAQLQSADPTTANRGVLLLEGVLGADTTRQILEGQVATETIANENDEQRTQHIHHSLKKAFVQAKNDKQVALLQQDVAQAHTLPLKLERMNRLTAVLSGGGIGGGAPCTAIPTTQFMRIGDDAMRVYLKRRTDIDLNTASDVCDKARCMTFASTATTASVRLACQGLHVLQPNRPSVADFKRLRRTIGSGGQHAISGACSSVYQRHNVLRDVVASQLRYVVGSVRTRGLEAQPALIPHAPNANVDGNGFPHTPRTVDMKVEYMELGDRAGEGVQRVDCVDFTVASGADGRPLTPAGLLFKYVREGVQGYCARIACADKRTRYKWSAFHDNERMVPFAVESRGYIEEALPFYRRWAAVAAERTGSRKSTILARWIAEFQATLQRENYLLVKPFLTGTGVTGAAQE